MPERNEALLRKVGDVIAAEPERYDQRIYIYRDDCGTTACIAGHAQLLGGETMGVVSAEDLLGLEGDELALFAPRWKPAGNPETPLHERVQAALYALADGADIEDVSA